MYSHHWPRLFLHFTFINTSAAAQGDIKGIAGSRGRAFSDTCSLVHQSLTGPSVTMKRFHNAARQKLILPLIHHAQPTSRSTDLICNAWLLAGDFLKAPFINSANPGMVLQEAQRWLAVSNCCYPKDLWHSREIKDYTPVLCALNAHCEQIHSCCLSTQTQTEAKRSINQIHLQSEYGN